MKITEQQLLTFLEAEFKQSREQYLAASEVFGKENNLVEGQRTKMQFVRELYFKITGVEL